MDGARYLTDRGIRQALDLGLLKFDPALEDRQIQPASIDLLLEGVEENFPIKGCSSSFCDGSVILSHHESELRTSQSISWAPGLKFYTELRSSLRRLSCYTPSGITMIGRGERVHVEVHNPGSIAIRLAPDDKIAQLMLFCLNFSSAASFYGCGYEEYKAEAEAHAKLLSLDCGFPVKSDLEAQTLFADGYFSVTPLAVFEKGMLCVHAGDTARVLRQNVVVNFSAKQDLSSYFDEVKLPYRLMPGEHLIVDTVENFELSPHIGIQFYEHLLGTSAGFSFSTHSSNRMVADFRLSSSPSGWVDPGYKGAFSRQPKTFFKEGVVIREGMRLGHGLIIFYPNGVERPYGSQGLNSHYQNAANTDVVQNRVEK